ncbi:OLC1v1020595C1 [Oldenlandia corymbosa var. corymbosa]|uniref:Pectinesterase n=1 Tax=Oldenlandia corymbosa var. corymbosa TaxID=529605 RepID=A0AAV1EGY9_OLDCO|nr:OLC1v1020595C1 [Oldenlandia corymbosa var. corymbosa]
MGYGDDGSKKKKMAVLGISSILLVAAVVGAVTYGISSKNNAETGAPAGGASASPSSSTKAVQSICKHVDYKETCENSLAKAGNTSDPKELVKVAFQVTVDNLEEVIKNSTLLKDAAKDPRTSQALETCKEVLDTAIDDFKRSFARVEEFDMSKVDEYLADLKTWLSGAITYQETCIDAFENTTGTTGEKMKQLLTTASQLSSNGLAMVSQFSEIIGTLNIPGFNRRLMSTEALDEQSYPDFVNAKQRKLLGADPSTLKPNAVIALDGSGTHKTFKDVINTIPKNNSVPFVILVKAGVYHETVMIPRKINNVYIFGEGPEKTKITGNKNYVDGIGTFHTATVAINGDNCILKDIAIENSAGAEKHQAVALRVSGDHAIVFNCRLDGYQDTLYSHNYRQFYRNTVISGTIDFIFGDAQAVFQNCTMVVRKPLENQGCMVTAQGRNNTRSLGAIIIQNSTITAEPEFLATNPLPRAYLGRPWKQYSRTLIMQSNIGGFILPEGWSPWMGTWGLDTLYYGEYLNTGAGAKTDKRVTWKGIQKVTPAIAESFTPGKYFMGDDWIKATGFPYQPGMF